MRMILFIWVLALVPAVAQVPVARLLNASRPSSGFRVGDRFEIHIAAGPNQAISVRTSRQGRTDWSPVIASTDSAGQWSTAGQFEERDFGAWSEMWTVGGKLASPAIQFWVDTPPCLPGRQNLFMSSGPNANVSCETSEGLQTFRTPGLADPFRAPDGRLVNGRPETQTQSQYYSEILQYYMGAGIGPAGIHLQTSKGGLGDGTAELISTLIGANALTPNEIRNSLAILRSSFEKPETMLPSARVPSGTLLLLRHLREITDESGLEREIDEAIAYFQAR
ncbi:MAG TPA: hypothetical protein VHW09_21345 [Bryobacteraceae bacterium]|jgi:hypothetical protein|nr:hypothetical protein [Bryobacteraceae bacterium]